MVNNSRKLTNYFVLTVICLIAVSCNNLQGSNGDGARVKCFWVDTDTFSVFDLKELQRPHLQNT